MDALEAKGNFEKLRPKLTGLCKRLKAELENAALSVGVTDALCSGRVKDIASFYIKVIEKGERYQPDPLAAMSDKVGVRIETLDRDDMTKVCQLIREGILGEVVKEDDKFLELGANRIGYQGIHFDIMPSDQEGISKEYRIVELQVRTLAQGVWAMVDHKWSYKSPVDLPVDIKRRLTKINVFMETFDEEVKRVKDKILSSDDYPIAKLVMRIEEERAKLGRMKTHSGKALTYKVIQDLLGKHTSPNDVPEALGAWIKVNERKLESVIAEYENADRQFFVDRPEGLLAFFLIDTKKYHLLIRQLNSYAAAY